jgi:hypothetical protein
MADATWATLDSNFDSPMGFAATAAWSVCLEIALIDALTSSKCGCRVPPILD